MQNVAGNARRSEKPAIKEAPLPMLIAIAITCVTCILLFFFPQPLFELMLQLPLS